MKRQRPTSLAESIHSSSSTDGDSQGWSHGKERCARRVTQPFPLIQLLTMLPSSWSTPTLQAFLYVDEIFNLAIASSRCWQLVKLEDHLEQRALLVLPLLDRVCLQFTKSIPVSSPPEASTAPSSSSSSSDESPDHDAKDCEESSSSSTSSRSKTTMTSVTAVKVQRVKSCSNHFGTDLSNEQLLARVVSKCKGDVDKALLMIAAELGHPCGCEAIPFVPVFGPLADYGSTFARTRCYCDSHYPSGFARGRPYEGPDAYSYLHPSHSIRYLPRRASKAQKLAKCLQLVQATRLAILKRLHETQDPDMNYGYEGFKDWVVKKRIVDVDSRIAALIELMKVAEEGMRDT